MALSGRGPLQGNTFVHRTLLGMALVAAALGAQPGPGSTTSTAPAVPQRNSDLVEPGWQRSYQAGQTDPAGHYLGGANIIHLVSHEGRLFAGNELLVRFPEHLVRRERSHDRLGTGPSPRPARRQMGR